jgi:D-alanyl-D-alanine carboxypeptidase (penicillin-binding protein 5/6)
MKNCPTRCASPSEPRAPRKTARIHSVQSRLSARFFVLIALLLLPFWTASSLWAQEVSADAYVIIDHQSGHVLEAHNADHKLQIASLTKIATATVALDWASASGKSLDQPALLPEAIAQLGPSPSGGIGFAPGDRASLRDLLYAALLQSDNAAALAVATHIGHELSPQANPPEVAFIAQMNALARKLGMERTRFLNPHGLDTLETKLPYSTAADVAKLAAYAMSNSAFRFLVSQKERTIQVRKADGSSSGYRLRNTNELLGHSEIDGVKTGTTQRAGQCLVLSAARSPEVKKNGDTFFITPRRLQVVLLGSENRFAEGETLLRHGWTLFQQWVAAGRPETPRSKFSNLSSNLSRPSPPKNSAPAAPQEPAPPRAIPVNDGSTVFFPQ